MRVGSREGMEVKDEEWVWRKIEVEMGEEVEWVWRRGGVRGEDENRDGGGDGEKKRRGVEVEEEEERRRGVRESGERRTC